jgi:putative membrane protein
MKTRTIAIAIGVALAAAVLLGGGWLLGNGLWAGGWRQASFLRGGYGSPWAMHTFGGGILMLLFWGAIIGGVALLVAATSRQSTQRVDERESPLDILKRRYASGEIDREEFERMKELLSS